jgi:predicted nucleotidyltransferase
MSIWAAAAQWVAGPGGMLRYRVAMASRDLIDQAGRALAAAAGADSKVILFGSHARGEERRDSDVDFLVIEPTVEDRVKEWARLRQALRDIHLPVDIIVLDEALAARRAKVPGTMVYHALRDGQVFAHS